MASGIEECGHFFQNHKTGNVLLCDTKALSALCILDLYRNMMQLFITFVTDHSSSRVVLSVIMCFDIFRKELFLYVCDVSVHAQHDLGMLVLKLWW